MIGGVRQLAVVDAEVGLQGIVALDDVIELLSEELTDMAELVVRGAEEEHPAATRPSVQPARSHLNSVKRLIEGACREFRRHWRASRARGSRRSRCRFFHRFARIQTRSVLRSDEISQAVCGVPVWRASRARRVHLENNCQSAVYATMSARANAVMRGGRGVDGWMQVYAKPDDEEVIRRIAADAAVRLQASGWMLLRPYCSTTATA